MEMTDQELNFKNNFKVQSASAIPVALEGFGAWDLRRKQHMVQWLNIPRPRTFSENPNPCCLAAWPNLLCSDTEDVTL